jgi:hypothetical protein
VQKQQQYCLNDNQYSITQLNDYAVMKVSFYFLAPFLEKQKYNLFGRLACHSNIVTPALKAPITFYHAQPKFNDSSSSLPNKQIN